MRATDVQEALCCYSVGVQPQEGQPEVMGVAGIECGQSTVLLAAGPGYLREALRAMLVSLQDVLILEADDTAAAKLLLHEHHPNLVIIDSDLPGNHTMQLVEAAKAEKPCARCTILVNDISQQAAAMRAGADHTPFKGEPPPRLFHRVEQLLHLH